MLIKVYAPAFINRSALDENGFLYSEETLSLKQLYRLLKVPLLLRPILLCSVNYEQVPMNTPLKDGDVVSFITPISGGSGH
jgi:molybdopterin converting factor small subunit